MQTGEEEHTLRAIPRVREDKNIMKNWISRLAIFAVVGAVLSSAVLSGCGGGDDAEDTAANTTTTTTNKTTETE